MKRFLLILALCGSAAAQELDPYQHLLDERAVLEARATETSAQVGFHYRKALYYRGLIIEGEGGHSEMLYHERKAEFFRDLYNELYAQLIIVNRKLPLELQEIY